MHSLLCPSCGQATVVAGQLVPGADSPRLISFLPDGLQIQSFDGHWWGVELPTQHHACVTCGHVWATIDPQALRSFLRANGGQSPLDSHASPGLPGLPDTAHGREIARNIAELDRLSRSGSPHLVSQRFRELMGVTPDQASAATWGWADLAPAEKLARFGWISKKPVLDDLAEPLF